MDMVGFENKTKVGIDYLEVIVSRGNETIKEIIIYPGQEVKTAEELRRKVRREYQRKRRQEKRKQTEGGV